jgi:hypothetical protein
MVLSDFEYSIDRLWGPPRLLSNGLFPQGKSGRGMKLTTYLYPMPGPRMVELYIHSPICLHGTLLN